MAQYANEEELRIFRSTNDIYDVVRLKLLGHLVVNAAIQEKKIQICKDRLTVGTWNVRSMNIVNLSTMKDEIKLLRTEMRFYMFSQKFNVYYTEY